MTHYYDTQAWLPKNVTFVNKAAFDALDKPTQDAVLKAAAQRRGARLEDSRKTRPPGIVEQLKSHGMKVAPPGDALKAGLATSGDQLTADWLKRAGPDGQAVIDAYKKM